MWVFGYGSLMWDGWERAFGGTRLDRAVLRGYRRSFNKKSVDNWGTPQRPGPTLGLEPDATAECVGTAFEIAEAQRQAVLAMLKKREGPSFTLPELPVRLPDGREIQAATPLNDRAKRTYIGGLAVAERATMARAAIGKGGRCADYVRNIRRRLRDLGVVDAAVEEIADLVERGEAASTLDQVKEAARVVTGTDPSSKRRSAMAGSGSIARWSGQCHRDRMSPRSSSGSAPCIICWPAR
jgi:cation transport protein ChaC